MKRSYRSTHNRKRESDSLAINTKQLTADERTTLRKALLRAADMKNLADVNTPSKRMSLLRRKMDLCLVRCDHNIATDKVESVLIANKRKLLLEILEFFGQRKFKSLDLLKHSFRLLWLNLFRALPDPQAIKTSPDDDEMDFREPAWDHLVLVYEIAFHVVTNTEIDKKIMQKLLRGKFLVHLVNLFKSLDDREPQYVKIILHAIYGRFMALRKDIRAYLSQFCYHYIYDTTYELFDSNTSITWQGIPEILAILCSIIQGLNVPVKSDYHLLLRNVLVPLHKTYHLDAFHEELIQCCTQFVLKDSSAAAVVLGGMLKFWPAVSPLKEQLFIDEIVHILSAAADYMENGADGKLEGVVLAVVGKLCSCMASPHHQVAERALLVWKEDAVKVCLEVYGTKCWPMVYKALKRTAEQYWLKEIRNITRNVIADLQATNPELFRRSFASKMRLERPRKVRAEEKRQKREREGRWRAVRQQAVHQINIHK